MTRRVLAILAGLMLFSASSCSDSGASDGGGAGANGSGTGDFGAPCESADDCKSGLICDIHSSGGYCSSDHQH